MDYLLDRNRLVTTAEKVSARIAERFPGSGLTALADGVIAAARAASDPAAAIERPNRWVRAGRALLVALALAAAAADSPTLPADIPVRRAALEFLDLTKGSAAVLAAAVFLFTLETRRKRGRARRAVHELRALAHVIDMHQLAKHPTQLGRAADALLVAGRALDAESMRLYLLACTGLPAVVSKLGQSSVRDPPDPASVTAVDQFENPATGLTGKIWQKLVVLDRAEGKAVTDDGRSTEPLDHPSTTNGVGSPSHARRRCPRCETQRAARTARRVPPRSPGRPGRAAGMNTLRIRPGPPTSGPARSGSPPTRRG